MCSTYTYTSYTISVYMHMDEHHNFKCFFRYSGLIFRLFPAACRPSMVFKPTISVCLCTISHPTTTSMCISSTRHMLVGHLFGLIPDVTIPVCAYMYLSDCRSMFCMPDTLNCFSCYEWQCCASVSWALEQLSELVCALFVGGNGIAVGKAYLLDDIIGAYYVS